MGTLKRRFHYLVTVTSSQARLENLKAVRERAGADHRFWFTTFAELTAASILTENIWLVTGRSDALQRLLPNI